MNLILSAQTRVEDLSKCVISYQGDSTLLPEKYEIDSKKEQVFYITPIMNYLDIEGEKYRTSIITHKRNWIEIHKLIDKLYPLTLNPNDSLTDTKITYSIEFPNSKRYAFNDKTVPGDLCRLVELIRNKKSKEASAQDEFLFSNLIGEWGVCCFETKHFGDSIAAVTNCNACPKLRFKSEKTAELMFPSGNIENVSWNLELGILILTNLSNGTNSQLLPTNSYSIELSKNGEYEELKLTIEEEKYSYTTVLRR